MFRILGCLGDVMHFAVVVFDLANLTMSPTTWMLWIVGSGKTHCKHKQLDSATSVGTTLVRWLCEEERQAKRSIIRKALEWRFPWPYITRALVLGIAMLNIMDNSAGGGWISIWHQKKQKAVNHSPNDRNKASDGGNKNWTGKSRKWNRVKDFCHKQG